MNSHDSVLIYDETTITWFNYLKPHGSSVCEFSTFTWFTQTGEGEGRGG